MENNEIISRIKLMMNYDSKKTLSENREILSESVNAEEISQELYSAKTNSGLGTRERDFKDALSKIKTLKDFADVQTLLKKRYNIESISKLINDEFGSDQNDSEFIEIIRKNLSQIPGIKATYEYKFGDGTGKGTRFKENSFKITTSANDPRLKKPAPTQSTDTGSAVTTPKKSETTVINAPTIEEVKNGKYIKYGMVGDSVGELQTKLNEKGGYKLIVDKKFGTNTKNAVIDFQKKNNITPAQGIFGPKTWRILFGPSSIESMSTKPLDLSNNPLPSNIEEPQLQTNVGTISNTTTSTDNNKRGTLNINRRGKF